MIQVNKEYLGNAGYTNKVIEQAKREMSKKAARYKRYTRSSYKSTIDIAMEYYIVNIASGYFGGISPEITVKQETNKKNISVLKKLFNKIVGRNADKEEFQVMVDYIREYNDDDTVFYELVKDYFITGSCYALQYETTDNKLVYARTPAIQTVALYDYSTPVQKVGLIRIWNETDEVGNTVEMVEVITETEKLYYKYNKKQDKEYKLDESMTEEVSWLLVPALAIENPDSMCIFTAVEDLIDAFETIIDNNKTTFEQNADAKLIAIGYAPENKLLVQDDNGNWITNELRTAEDNAVLNAKMLYVSGDSENRGDFKWLIKDLNDTASENHKKTLMELILMTACIPNVTDVGFTKADNSSALEKKFFPLEQIIIQAEKQFKKEYLAMFENFIDRVNTKYSTDFDFTELQITFKRNLPTDRNELVDMALKLRNILSDESVMRLLPLDIDIESEIAKKKEQSEENIMKFQSNIKDGGLNVGQDRQRTDEEPEELQEEPTNTER